MFSLYRFSNPNFIKRKYQFDMARYSIHRYLQLGLLLYCLNIFIKISLQEQWPWCCDSVLHHFVIFYVQSPCCAYDNSEGTMQGIKLNRMNVYQLNFVIHPLHPPPPHARARARAHTHTHTHCLIWYFGNSNKRLEGKQTPIVPCQNVIKQVITNENVRQ
jgi:hypothetical protein